MSCFCDYDYPSFYCRSTPTAKKRHKCEECSGYIEVGEKYEYVSGKWDGEFGTFKTCVRCHDLRQWVKNNVPCLCWAHGNTWEDLYCAVQDAHERARGEVPGLMFGFLRRQELIRRHNSRKRAA